MYKNLYGIKNYTIFVVSLINKKNYYETVSGKNRKQGIEILLHY